MKLSTLLSRTAAAATFALAASAASADTYDFLLTGAYSAHWELSSPVTPDHAEEGEAFVLYDVAGTFPGATTGLVDLYFVHGDLDGGIGIIDAGDDAFLMVGFGTQLYTGPASAPTFLVGSFALDGAASGFGTYTLTITNLSAVPEPESYALLLAGIGALGLVAARRRKS